ncbi:MAG: DNA helicase RecQ [Pirellulaceae bacterium]
MDAAMPVDTDSLLEKMRHYWGYDRFRPLQREAMEAVLADRDSVVVMPTGGGKSLCYQVPSLCKPGLAVVISPLISLMKDQVDALTACGVQAACVNSTVPVAEKRRAAEGVREGWLKLLYLAPERLVTDRTLDFLQSANVSFLAIDEAHCISEWGHDFRPEYRQLKVLRDRFPNLAIHCYTATATEQVRHDIARQLELRNHDLLVGSFDRPNLSFQVQRRADRLSQIREVLNRHRGESGIIYCIRRADVEEIAAQLNSLGYNARPYHAGLSDVQRKTNQEDFIQDRVETIVATVAFGMGIDKPNVRYVVHAGMPKSLENYQQESGRAGRDGLQSECVLLYSSGDLMLWKRMLDDLPPEAQAPAMASLDALDKFCVSVTCRHQALVGYFGQTLESDTCQACDVCLGEVEMIPDALVVGQKILSCVVRLNERFGADYTAKVLNGSKDKRILEMRHDQLSTYGLLTDHPVSAIRDWIEQLVGQSMLAKTGEYNTLAVTQLGWQVLKGEVEPKLIKSRPQASSTSARAAKLTDDWAGVDRGLFDDLRELRKAEAEKQAVPAYVVFGDATLRDLARLRPTTIPSFRRVKGVGEKRCLDFGPQFTQRIASYCQQHELTTDLDPAPFVQSPEPGPSSPAFKAFDLFREGLPVAEVAQRLERAESTTFGYLADFIRHERVTDPAPWVEPQVLPQIEAAAEACGLERLKPIFEHLDQAVPYEAIRIVTACLRNR